MTGAIILRKRHGARHFDSGTAYLIRQRDRYRVPEICPRNSLGDSVPNPLGLSALGQWHENRRCGVFQSVRVVVPRQAARALVRLPCYWRKAKNAGVRGGAPWVDICRGTRRCPVLPGWRFTTSGVFPDGVAQDHLGGLPYGRAGKRRVVPGEAEYSSSPDRRPAQFAPEDPGHSSCGWLPGPPAPPAWIPGLSIRRSPCPRRYAPIGLGRRH